MTIRNQEDLLRDCYDIVLAFLKDRKLEDFWEPVKWEELGLYDYLERIKNPMDLTTMKNKFESNQYSNIFEFAYDMRLMWTNCLTYNQDGCIVVEIAKRYQRQFEERFTKLLNSTVIELAFMIICCLMCRNVQNSMKRALFHDISKLNSDQVSTILQLLWEICPDVLSNSSDVVSIEIDHLSKYAYYIILAYVNSLRETSTNVE